MKVGVKIYSSDYKLIPHYLEHADFIEVLIEPEKDFTMLKQYETDYVIHVAHGRFGFNPSDKNAWDLSKKIMDYSKQAADLLSVSKMIVHPGHCKNEFSTEKNIVDFLKENYDSRIILENLPKNTKYNPFFFSEPEEIKRIAEKLDMNICLDFAHATCAAATLKIDYLDFISKLNKFHPKHYHLCDGFIISETDSHLPFFKGDYPLEKFKSMIPGDGEVTIETRPKDIESVLKEIAFLRI